MGVDYVDLGLKISRKSLHKFIAKSLSQASLVVGD